MPNYRLVRYADDFLVLIFGRREHAEELRDEVAEALKPMGLRLSVEKTNITHIDEGLDFFGWRIQRHRKLGTAGLMVQDPEQPPVPTPGGVLVGVPAS